MKTTKILKELRWLLLLAVISILGCGGGSGGGDGGGTATVTGTLTLPADASGMEYVVQIDTNFDGDDGQVKSLSGTCGSGHIVNYSIPDVPAGTYNIYAIVRNVSVADSSPQAGDYAGIYGYTATSTSWPLPNAIVPSSGTTNFDILLGIYDGENIAFGGGGDSATITGASGSQVALNGNWSPGCVADTVEGESEKEVSTISGSSFSAAGNSWLGSTTCSGSPEMTFRFSGTFTLGEEVTAGLNGSSVTATKADITATSLLLTVHDPDVVAFFNTNIFCGATDWAVDTAKEVVGTECMPASYKDILYIDDTVDPDLFYFGIQEDEGGTLDPNGYPTELDAEVPEARL